VKIEDVDAPLSFSSSAPANVTKAAAAAGGSSEASRADHKHDITTAAPLATGMATASGEGSATTLARSDHAHQSNTAPANVTKAAATIGTSGEPARADHKHDVTTATAVAIATANSEGSATSLSRSDHVHAHGDQTSTTLHAVATALLAGFMSATDKDKLDSLPIDVAFTDAYATEQTTNIGAGDHVKFNTVARAGGTGISVDTSTAYTTTLNVDSVGRITLAANATYEIRAQVPKVTFSALGSIRLAIINADTGSVISRSGLGIDPTSITTEAGDLSLVAVLSVSVATRIELRIVAVTNLTQIGQDSTSLQANVQVTKQANAIAPSLPTQSSVTETGTSFTDTTYANSDLSLTVAAATAGKCLVLAGYSGYKSSGSAERIDGRLTNNAVKITGTEDTKHTHSSMLPGAIQCSAIAQLAVGDVVRLQWKTGGGTISVTDRRLFVIRLGV
jgi:hypothetical protein